MKFEMTNMLAITDKVREWAGSVWNGWSQYHPEVAAFVSQFLEVELYLGR